MTRLTGILPKLGVFLVAAILGGSIANVVAAPAKPVRPRRASIPPDARVQFAFAERRAVELAHERDAWEAERRGPGRRRVVDEGIGRSAEVAARMGRQQRRVALRVEKVERRAAPSHALAVGAYPAERVPAARVDVAGPEGSR